MLSDTFQMIDKKSIIEIQLTKYKQHGMQRGTDPLKLELPSPKNS